MASVMYLILSDLILIKIGKLILKKYFYSEKKKKTMLKLRYDAQITLSESVSLPSGQPLAVWRRSWELGDVKYIKYN